MSYSTLDLLTREWYSRSIEKEDAIAELNSRGWNVIARFIVLALLVPLILPERLICWFGGDDWDDGPTSWKSIIFSVSFSALMILAFVFAFGLFRFAQTCIVSGCISTAFPFLSALLLLVAWITLNKSSNYPPS